MAEESAGLGPRHKAMLMRYEKGERRGPKTEEAQRLHGVLIGAEVLPPHPRTWLGKVIVDVSANNGLVDFELARMMNQSIQETADAGGLKAKEAIATPIEFRLFDIAYADQGDQPTKLGRGAKKEAQKTDQQLPFVKIHSPEQKNAASLTRTDLGGRGVDVVIDRLGALWHGIDMGKDKEERIARTEHLLDALENLLNEGGAIVVDDYQYFGHRESPGISTGTQLVGLFGSQEKLEEFLSEKGFETQRATWRWSAADGARHVPDYASQI